MGSVSAADLEAAPANRWPGASQHHDVPNRSSGPPLADLAARGAQPGNTYFRSPLPFIGPGRFRQGQVHLRSLCRFAELGAWQSAGRLSHAVLRFAQYLEPALAD